MSFHGGLRTDRHEDWSVYFTMERVHGRRTRNMYRKAFGIKKGVGIIALHDRWCQRWTWWTTVHGWHQMLREMLAWPGPWLINGTDEHA